MNEKNFPTWMLLAVVVGLGELSYYLWKHYGFGVATKAALVATGIAAVGTGLLYLVRAAKHRAVKK